jgi:hypothetical protein
MNPIYRYCCTLVDGLLRSWFAENFFWTHESLAHCSRVEPPSGFMDYIVLRARGPNRLREQVLTHIEEGWRLQGGVACESEWARKEPNRRIFQAMVRD